MNLAPQLEATWCHARQARLRQRMAELQLDWVLVGQLEHVQYYSSVRFAPTFSPWFAISLTGPSLLVGPDNRIPDHAVADQVATYSARWHSTLRNDQRQVATQVLTDLLSGRWGNQRVGVEFSQGCRHLPEQLTYVDIEPDLFRFRRRKDPDELAILRRAIQATERMYATAREILRPGTCELELFSALQAAAVRELGEPLTATGNDYQCNSRGGSPRARQAEAGELYILDLGPAYRGYFADNARTLAVTEPTASQLAAWQEVVTVFDLVEQTVRPGVSARALFEQAEQHLRNSPWGVFNHHLGHGIGLYPHEAPHLNPFWDDVFEVGDLFTVEPGLYGPELRAGMRIENDYLVTENGVERLTEFPLELKL